MSHSDLPARKYAETSNGVYWKVNEAVTVVHTVRGNRLCCLGCRSNDCEHTRSVARYEREEAAA